SQGTNLNSDPLFVNPAAMDFRLQEGSPCIDAANGTEAPSTDMDGDSRWDDPAVTDTGTGTPTYADIGCYERQP
ncbi:MAG: choice-of-anchor Q domain-containing protein, partial [Polyangia bacterium]|nr:choice-of-anchor Q domain-containing protein [Polyangia bacterium]